MDFNLPKRAYVNKFIPKNKFFSKTVVNSKLKQEFVDSIARITWTYKIAESTVNINKTDNIEEIEIFEIELKEKQIPKNILKIIDKTIPYPILYIFRYMEHFAYGITLKEDSMQRYYFSDWDEEKIFNFSGTTIERVYQNIVTSFIDIGQKSEDFVTIVKQDKEKERLEREIQTLKSKIKKEVHFNKKVELNTVLQTKQKEYTKIINPEK
jgi:hypothetical protein